VAQHLADEERVALRLPVERRRQRRLAGSLLARWLQHRQQRQDVLLPEAAHQHAPVRLLAAQRRDHLGQRVRPVQLDVAVGREDQHALAGDGAR